MTTQDLDVSEPRRPTPDTDGAAWVVDVVKGGSKVLATLGVTHGRCSPIVRELEAELRGVEGELAGSGGAAAGWPTAAPRVDLIS